MKVGKEEMMGCMAALDYWSKADYPAITREWQRRLESIAKMVETVPGVTTSISSPPIYENDSFPTLHVTWDVKKFGLTVEQCNDQLRAGDPRIEVQTNENHSGVLARIRTTEAPLGLGRPLTDELRILPITMQPAES